MTALGKLIIDKLPNIAADTLPRGDCVLDMEFTGAANQCVLFLKPEATTISAGVDVEEILEITLAALSAHHVSVRKSRILNGAYLQKFSIMDAHYGVINRISQLGELALSVDSKSRLADLLKDDWPMRIMGGHQFQAAYKDLSSFALNVLSDSVGTRKLGGGTYFIVAKAGGESIAVLNPFHLHQLDHFTAPGKAIVLFACETDTTWSQLRQDLIGATNPATAKPGSIRATLLRRQKEIHLPEVSQGVNGVHLSAGPAEGMVEYQRFFSDHFSDCTIPFGETTMGSILIQKGWDAHRVKDLASNPNLLLDGKQVSAFDATEEFDTSNAIDLLIAEG